MRIAVIIGLLACFAVGVAGAQDSPKIPERPQVLKELDGHWIMSGDVLGKPAKYKMVAGPTLQGAFTEMHMKDVHVPSQYEARVFIGYDQKSKVVIAHWLDNFGAMFSIPHGTGSIVGNTIQFTIPYKDGPFRDTLTYNPGTKSWVFVIVASQPDGTWKHFARYNIHRE